MPIEVMRGVLVGKTFIEMGGIKMKDDLGFRQYLNNNERVFWEGHSHTNFIITIWDLFYFIVGSICLLPFINTLPNGNLHMFEVVLSIIFCAFILFFFMFGRIFMRYFIRKRTIYILTNERIIIFNKSSNKIIKEQDIKSTKNIRKKVGRNGIGRIEFGKISIAQIAGGNSGFDELAETRFVKKFTKMNAYFDDGADQMIPVFYDIRDVDYVYDLVNSLGKA